MVTVRSHAVAAFCIGRGIEPLDFDSDAELFIFSNDAKPAVVAYRDAMAKLNALKDGAK